jgi:hypothetical protein
MKKIHIVLTAALFLVTVSVMAQTATPRADKRQKAQRVRIADGRQDGDLTNGEAALLNKEQRHIRRSERRAKADGEVSVREKARLERKQNRASRHVRRAKTNDLDKKD